MNTFAVGVPSIVELALVLVRPLRPNMVRAVDSSRCPIHQKGFVGSVRLAIVDPGQGLVHHVFGEMIFRIFVRRLHGIVVFHEARLPLRCFAGQEAIKIVETISVGPAVLRSHGGGFGRGRVVPLAESGGAVPVMTQHFGNGRGFFRNDTGVAVEGDRPLGDCA